MTTVWRPTGDPWTSTNLGRFLGGLAGAPVRGSYEDVWRWSVDDIGHFWTGVWDHFAVGERGDIAAVQDGGGLRPRWFEGATLNWAGHMLARRGSDTAVIGCSDARGDIVLTWDELHAQVARCRTGLRRLGVGRGDVVAAYAPNVPEALVALLAVASLGATWASCPPEFGARAVIDRLRPLAPTVLLAVAGYRYGTKSVDRTDELALVRSCLPGLRHVVVIPIDGRSSGVGDVAWDDLVGGEAAPLELEPVPFDHPLCVLFSSGTTGPPKGIVHGHGGILLEHLKVWSLQLDVGPGDRVLWYTTTGWMMWNLLVSALGVGAAVVLFDGDPMAAGPSSLWEVAARTGTTFFGSSAGFLAASAKAGLDLGHLEDLRALGSTGAPLPAEVERWLAAARPGTWITSISGGTDVASAFVGDTRWKPVVAGEMAARYLGCDVMAFDGSGAPVTGQEGELVVRQPMPSMPVGFVGDLEGEALRRAYFDRFPDVWCHGDWLTVTADGRCRITGRSDATLNRGGVRLGTSEIYDVVEAVPGVSDSLVVHLDDPAGGAGRLVLFVSLEPSATFTEPLVAEISSRIRLELSPRHVPDEVLAVAGIPRTHSGKKVELPVKRILAGVPPERAVARASLQDPGALDRLISVARHAWADYVEE